MLEWSSGSPRAGKADREEIFFFFFHGWLKLSSDREQICPLVNQLHRQTSGISGSGLCTKCSKQPKQTYFRCAEKFTQWSITAVQYCTGIRGGVGWSFPTEPGQSGLIIGSAPAGDVQSFMSFALIPHLTKHAAVRVPDMLCLSGHLDVHLVSRGACLSISLPDGLALITPSYVSPPRAANADSAAAFEASAARCCRVRGIKRWFVRQGEQSSANVAQASTSSKPLQLADKVQHIIKINK